MAVETSRHHERLPHDERRGEILAAVRVICSERGLSRLSISAVTERAGCTRSLFYHYFPTKENALEAALDESIDRFLEQLETWNGARELGDIEGALDSVSAMLKDMILGDDDLPRSLASGGNASIYTAFVNRVADRCARYLCETAAADFAAHHEVRIDHVYETFYVLICGLIMFIRTHPDAPASTVKDIIASTLHIEGYTDKYPERRPAR